MYRSCCYPSLFQVVHLVFHQGDQRAYDQAGTLLHECRNLEADRFSTSGRKQGKRIFLFEDGVNNDFLHRPEAGVSPVLCQYFSCLGAQRVKKLKFKVFDQQHTDYSLASFHPSNLPVFRLPASGSRLPSSVFHLLPKSENTQLSNPIG